MNMRKYRDIADFLLSLFFCWVYIPHLIVYFFIEKKALNADLRNIQKNIQIRIPLFCCLLFALHNDAYFRTIFYYRIGFIAAFLISWYRPGCKYFIISQTAKIKGGLNSKHPYSTILNAGSIGENFTFRHLTTIGNKEDGSPDRPIIMNNVTLGANVTIIGKVKIGNNVSVGAGSVVVKDIPDNCVVVGNPARIISRNGIRISEKL